MPTSRALGIWNSGSGFLKVRACQPLASACFFSARSGFTATGLPTNSSMGMSVAESEYA